MSTSDTLAPTPTLPHPPTGPALEVALDAAAAEHAYLFAPGAGTAATLRSLLPLLFDDPVETTYLAEAAADPRLVCGYDPTTRTLAVIAGPGETFEDLLEEATSPRAVRVEDFRLVAVDDTAKGYRVADLDPITGTPAYVAAFFEATAPEEHGRLYPRDQQLMSQANRLETILDLAVTVATGGDYSGIATSRTDADWGYHWRTATALRLVRGPKTALEPTRAGLRLAALSGTDQTRAMAAHVARSHVLATYRSAGDAGVDALLLQAERRLGTEVVLSPSTRSRRLQTLAAWNERVQGWENGHPEAPTCAVRPVVDLGAASQGLTESGRSRLRSEWGRQVKEISPRAFEFLACEVWHRAGMREPVVTQQSGDKGIDFEGVADTPDGPVRVVAQAKHRRDGKVGASVGDDRVRALRGSLRQYAGDQGVLITNGTFSKQAHEEAASNYPIVLVDGEQLADLAIDHGVGVEHLGGGKYAVGGLETFEER